MPSFCVVSNCEYKYTHAENVSFHKFPHPPELLKKWIEFTERGTSWKPSRWSAICSRHFLPSDFRDYLSRKCLKKDAVPSVTMKQFDGSFLDFQGESKRACDIESEPGSKSACRLCGVYCKPIETFLTNYQIFGMIQKCFPTLNINQDNLSKHICSSCLQRLKFFSDFIDEVLQTQKQFEENIVQEINHVVNNDKQLKIKQEPIVNVKQEITDVFHNYFNDGFGGGGVDDDVERELEKKYQLIDLPFINNKESINNCDIMEIIPLNDGFIDIPDDEIEDDISKIDFKMISTEEVFSNITEEHAYAKIPDNTNADFAKYKTEKCDESELKPLVVSDVIVINNGNSENEGNGEDKFKQLQSVHKEYICSICNNLVFSSINTFLYHKNQFHKTKKVNLQQKSTKLFCLNCKKYFCSKLALNNHRKYSCKYGKKEYYCKYCKKRLKWNFLNQHERLCKNKAVNVEKNDILLKRNEKETFSCRICDRTYLRFNNLLKHELTHRAKEQWNFKCGNCDRLFDYMYDLRLHFTTNKCSNLAAKSEQFFFVCSICGKQLKSLQRLKLHRSIHSSKKPYVCESCGKAFRCFNNLYQHRVTHSDVRRYKCDMCDKMFKRKGGLNQHKKAYHLKLKPYECLVCKHKFALKGDMLRCKHSILKN